MQSEGSATLDRIQFYPEFIEEALGAMHPGMQMMITDLTADPETRSDRDFVINFLKACRVSIMLEPEAGL
jgi:hypothetical protein